MGAGYAPAGGWGGGPAERAGISIPYVGTPPAAVPAFRAIAFDPTTRTFTFDSEGHAEDVHPVDQRVALLLWVGFGRVPSSPSTGTAVRDRVQRIAIALIPGVVRDEVRKALRPLVDAGDIALLRIDVKVAKGRTEYAVFYRNLRAPTTDATQGRRTANGSL